MPTMKERGTEVGNELLGSCGAIGDHATDEEQNNGEFCAELEEVTQQCDTCGWWCEPGEMNDTGVCEDCAEEESE